MRAFLSSIACLVILFLGESPRVSTEEPVWLDTLQSISRDTDYRLVDEVPLNFNTYHPQGMTVVGDKIYLSSVHTLNKQDGKGHGYLFELNLQGELLRTLELGEGAAYHPSGLDFDGQYIWVAVAEYRRDSSTIIYRVDPKIMKSTEVFRFNDHIGGLVSVPTRKELIGVSWGARRIYRWKLHDKGGVTNPVSPEKVMNGNHFIDYQDGQWVAGTDYLIMGGLSSYRGVDKSGDKVAVGGLALVNSETLHTVWTSPIALYSKKGRVMNQNPFYVQGMTDGSVKLYFIPDDNGSVLYTFSVQN